MESSTFRVLVVDDYEAWRRFASKTLQKRPGLHIISEASDGLDAVQKAQDLQPDLILLDVGLPKLNGIEAARRIREVSPQSTILFVSDNYSLDIVEEALKTGARGYVVKSDAASDLLSAVISVLQGKQFVSPRFSVQNVSQVPDTHLVSDRAHVVQFYTRESVLLDGLASSFRNALVAGESVVAVVTASHRSALEKRLIAQGTDLSEATQNGRFRVLDAKQALNDFMESIGPNRERFLLQFGDLIRRAQAAAMAKSKRVVVFGEMVSVLWDQQKYDATVQLEELWNELAQTCSFFLCCGYPASAFPETLEGSHYATICALHSDVVSVS